MKTRSESNKRKIGPRIVLCLLLWVFRLAWFWSNLSYYIYLCLKFVAIGVYNLGTHPGYYFYELAKRQPNTKWSVDKNNLVAPNASSLFLFFNIWLMKLSSGENMSFENLMLKLTGLSLFGKTFIRHLKYILKYFQNDIYGNKAEYSPYSTLL